MRRTRFRALPIELLAALCVFAGSARAENLEVTVHDSSGEAVADAVVYAVPSSGRTGRAAPTEIDQVDKEEPWA